MKMISDLKKMRHYIEVTEEEKQELNRIKEYFKKQLDLYVENEREDIDLQVSSHLRLNGIHGELINLRYHIINDLDYNDDYKDVVHFKNGFVEFVDDDRFLLFANAYNILSDTSRAERVLRNILRVQLIEWLIKYQYTEDNTFKTHFRIPDNHVSTVDINDDRNSIFNNSSELFLKFCIDNSNNVNRKFLSMLYGYMSHTNMLYCNQLDFAIYWNQNYKTPEIKLYKNKAGLDTMDWKHSHTKHIEELKIEYDNQMIK